MKKKMIRLGRFQLNLSDRTSYTLIALVSIILLGVGVYAFGTPNPAVFGHSGGELDFSGATINPGGLNVVNTGPTQFELRSSNGGTPYLDFSNDASTDYDMRLILSSDDGLVVQGGSLGVSGLCINDDCRTSWPATTSALTGGLYGFCKDSGWGTSTSCTEAKEPAYCSVDVYGHHTCACRTGYTKLTILSSTSIDLGQEGYSGTYLCIKN